MALCQIRLCIGENADLHFHSNIGCAKNYDPMSTPRWAEVPMVRWLPFLTRRWYQRFGKTFSKVRHPGQGLGLCTFSNAGVNCIPSVPSSA
jgi:hypothetical protein